MRATAANTAKDPRDAGGQGGRGSPPILCAAHEGQGEPSEGGERAPSVRLKPLRALSVR